MMVFMIIFFIISVILESLVSNLIVNFIPFFIPCFIVVFASLKINRDYFYKTLIVAGIIYDLMYTNQVVLNALLFCFYGFLVSFILKSSKNFMSSYSRMNSVVSSEPLKYPLRKPFANEVQ